MSWLRLDDGFAQHPKVADLTDREFRAWVKLLLYCARYRTEGDVTEAALRELGVGKAARDTFVSVGLLDVEETEWHVHDWSSYNPSDPTNADRQARFRAKRRQKRNGGSNGERNAESNGPDRYGNGPSRVGAPARPVPSSPSVTGSSSTTTEDPVPAAAPELEALGWRDWQIERAALDPDRAQAWVEAAKTRANGNPGGYAWSGFDSGDWPKDWSSDDPQGIDVVAACQKFIAGLGWDETVDQWAMMIEFERIERSPRTTGRLTEGDYDGLVEQWKAERQDRYGIPANLTAKETE